MNFISKGLPMSIDVGSYTVPINTDFRVWMEFENLSGTCKSDESLAEKTLEMMFPDGLLEDIDIDELTQQIILFYCCGQSKEDLKARHVSGEHSRIYDYEYDSGYVYAAFMQQYGISLTEVEYLHWWEYKALFDGLTDKCKFTEIIGYRAAEITSDMSSKQKEHIRKMKKLYTLPLPQDEQSKISALDAALMGDGDLRGLL